MRKYGTAKSSILVRMDDFDEAETPDPKSGDEAGDMEQLVARVHSSQMAASAQAAPGRSPRERDDYQGYLSTEDALGRGAISRVWRWGWLGLVALLLVYGIAIAAIYSGRGGRSLDELSANHVLDLGKWGLVAALAGLVIGMVLGALRESIGAIARSPIPSDRDASGSAVGDPFADRFAQHDGRDQARSRQIDVQRADKNFVDADEIEVVAANGGIAMPDVVRMRLSLKALRRGTLVGGNVAIGFVALLVVARLYDRYRDWSHHGSLADLVIELILWLLVGLFLVGGGAFLGRVIGLLIAFGEGWRRDLLRGDAVRSDGTQADGQLHSGSLGSRRSISQYVRWPVMGSICALVAYAVLRLGLTSKARGRAMTDLLIVDVVGLLFELGAAAIFGALVGLCTRSWRDLIAAWVAPTSQPSRMPEIPANDPFADRFGQVGNRQSSQGEPVGDFDSTQFIDPEEIEVVREPMAAEAVYPANAGNTHRRLSMDTTMFKRWAVLGAFIALGVSGAVMIFVIGEWNRQARGNSSLANLIAMIVALVAWILIASAIGATVGVFARGIWELLGLSRRTADGTQTTETDPATADPFADRFGGGK